MTKEITLIDVPASIAANEIVTKTRPEPVANSMLTRLRYKGANMGRYILESEKDNFFKEEAPEAPEAPAPEEVLKAETEAEPEEAPDEEPKPKRRRSTTK